MTNHWACNNSNKTDATCEAGAFYLPQHLSSPQILVWFVLSDFCFFGVDWFSSFLVEIREIKIGSKSSGISDELRDMYYICRCCWNVHSGKIEQIIIYTNASYQIQDFLLD
jgi:hypothetical protein